MNEPVDYPYATGDLLEQQQTYFYSAFHGTGFIRAWRYDRDTCLHDLAAHAQADASRCDSATAQLLERMAEQLRASEFSQSELGQLDMLLRNFEAKKRIYEDYNPGFTSMGRHDFRALCLYVRFAEVLVLAYRRWQALPYLNALMKCVDILCAMRGGLVAADQRRVVGIIMAEADFVAELMRKLGVVY